MFFNYATTSIPAFSLLKLQQAKPKILLRFGVGKILVLVAKQGVGLARFNSKRERQKTGEQVRLFFIVEEYPTLWVEIFPSPFQRFPLCGQRGLPRRPGR